MAGSVDVRSARNVLEPAGGVPLKNAKSWHSHVVFVHRGMLVGLACDYLVGGVTEFCYPLVAMGAKDKGEQHPPGARGLFPTCRATILPTLNMNGWILVGAWGGLASCRCDQNRGNRILLPPDI